jgi:hypothetical protein
MCHLQGVSYVLMSYLKAELVMLFVMYCECCWSVCTGCCSFVCYVVQLSVYRVFGSCGCCSAISRLQQETCNRSAYLLVRCYNFPLRLRAARSLFSGFTRIFFKKVTMTTCTNRHSVWIHQFLLLVWKLKHNSTLLSHSYRDIKVHPRHISLLYTAIYYCQL